MEYSGNAEKRRINMNIAIDGPAGAGKSTIAKLVSQKLGFIYVDTGAMYRAIALYFLNNNIDVDNNESVLGACNDIKIDIKYEDNNQQVYLNGENVSSLIRQEKVGNMASKVAAKQAVRNVLLQLQRDIAASSDVIMDGRDIGTFVLPNAELKIYLTASVSTRAKRRYDELVLKGENPDMKTIEKDIEQRDFQDMNREISPLKQADDAIYLDTSDMSIDEVVEFICSKAK